MIQKWISRLQDNRCREQLKIFRNNRKERLQLPQHRKSNVNNKSENYEDYR